MPEQPDQPPVPTEGAVLLGGEDGMESVAKKLGILCRSCSQPLTNGGFLFIALEPKMTEEGPTIKVHRAFLCDREECAEAREEARKQATAWQPVPAWSVPDDGEEHGDGK